MAILGAAGSSGGGYSQLRMQSNFTGFIEDESKKSIEEMAEKGQLVCFPTEGVYSKAVYDKLQALPGSYLVVCEPMAVDDTESYYGLQECETDTSGRGGCFKIL